MHNQINSTSANKSHKLSDSTSTTRERPIYYLYKIKVSQINEKPQHLPQTELCLYLRLIFADQTQIQTPCIDIISSKQFFQIQVQKAIEKIQVINYDNLKKLAKISLKGTQREFNVLYKDPKRDLSLNIIKKKQIGQTKQTNSSNLSKKFTRVEERTFEVSQNDVSNTSLD